MFLLLDEIVKNYNTSWHSAINRTPFESFRKRSFGCIDLVKESKNEVESSDTDEEYQIPCFDFVSEIDDVDAEQIRHHGKYLQRTNFYKQVHIRKKDMLIGDSVLVKLDFDNNQTSKKEKFTSFFKEDEFEIVEKLTTTLFKVKNKRTSELSEESIQKLKKIKK